MKTDTSVAKHFAASTLLTLESCGKPENGNKTGNVHINVALTRVRVTTVVVEKYYTSNIFRVCVCSLSYCSTKAYAPIIVSYVKLSGSNTFSLIS
jgi:hypothetical protein